jgi:hypothetical protein
MLSCSKLEHDDMASDQYQDKSTATGQKPPRDRRPPAPQQPQIPSPLCNYDPELVRDSHC